MRTRQIIIAQLLLLFCLRSAGALAAEPVMRLTGVPDELVFPLPKGSNRILTATVTGAAPRAVWLAKDADAKLRISLTKTGEGEYQINLADSDVLAAIRIEAAETGRLQIFAEFDNKKVLASMPVSYAIKPEAKFAPKNCRIYSGEKAPPTNIPGPGEYWVEDVQRVEFPVDKSEFKTSLPVIDVSDGDMSWVVRLERRGDHLQLPLTANIRNAWKKAGKLSIGSISPYVYPSVIVLKKRPRKLEFPGNVATVEIHQRQSVAIPGSRDYLRASIGDITANQVMLTLQTAEGDQLIPKMSARQGDSLTFEFADEKYALYVRKLVNLLIGDDFALVDVSSVASSELKTIDRLLVFVETAPIKLIRDGKEYNGREAAAHLRQKLAAAGPRVKTAQQFVDKIASKSSTSGRPYLVRQKDGSTVPAKQWLKRVLDNELPDRS